MKGYIKSAYCAGDSVGEVVFSDMVTFNTLAQDTLTKNFHVLITACFGGLA